MATVLIGEDDEGVRDLLSLVVDKVGRGLRTVGEASTGKEVLDLWDELEPDIVVLDHRMPDMDGLEVAERMLGDQPNTAVILCTAYLDEQIWREARKLGIRACVGKDRLSRLSKLLRELAAAA